MPTSRNRSKQPSQRESMRRAFQSGAANRVSNRELRRRAQTAIQRGLEAYKTLLVVLAQKGGEVTVTRGTIDQVNETYARLSFVVEKKDGEFVVRLQEIVPQAETGAETKVEMVNESKELPEYEDDPHDIV